MVRAMTWTLRQRRYRALAIAMFIVAVGCISAGTFELHRYHEKVRDNAALTANTRAAVTSLPALGVTTNAGSATGVSIRYRSVRVAGTFDADGQTYLGNESVHGREGYFVITPLRTAGGTVLVARGFVASTATGARPARIASPPDGAVSVVGRVYPTESTDDQLGRLSRGEIDAVNADDQATRLGTPVYRAWLTLNAGQAGTSGLTALPGPPRSNPSGGASQWQLLSYVVQWYAFAVLALIAPFFFARAEVREARRRFLGVDAEDVQFDLPAETPAALESLSALPAVRAGAELTKSAARTRIARAEKLADRYGRSLGPDPAPWTGRGVLRRSEQPATARRSAETPHRSDDAYHGSYNDYLWQRALADGNMPDVLVPDSAGDAPDTERPPRVIDVPTDSTEPAPDDR